MVRFKLKKIAYLFGFLTAAVAVPIIIAACGSSSTTAATPAATKYLYLFSDDSAGSGDNLLVKINTSDNSVVSSTTVGFNPSWPANNPNSGSIIWGTDSDGSTTKIYGVNVTTGLSALKPSFAAIVRKMFADTSKIFAPEIAQAKPTDPTYSCDINGGNSAPAVATWTGTAVAGGGTWTAVTSDGSKVWVANRVDDVSLNGVYQMFNTSGVLQLTVDPITGITTNNVTSTTVNDFQTNYASDGGAAAMPQGNAGLSVAQGAPCDISISTIGGTEYGWGVDVNGDTLTGFNSSTGVIVGQMIFKPLGPDQEATGFIAPFMNTNGKTANGTDIVTTENLRGARSESIVDVSTPASPVELVRIYENFLDASDVAWPVTGIFANYTDKSTTYQSKLSGAYSTKIYEWTTPPVTAGYPKFIVDGLSAGTTSEIAPNGKFAYILGGASIPVIDLTGSAPWVVSRTITNNVAGGASKGVFTPDSSKFFLNASATGVVPVIDTSIHMVTDLIAITGKAGGGTIF